MNIHGPGTRPNVTSGPVCAFDVFILKCLNTDNI